MKRIPALLGLGTLALACAESTDLGVDGRDAGDAGAHDEATRDDGSNDTDVDATDGGCPPGRTDCSGVCVDLTSDPANCGDCGRRCGAAEVCNESSCASTCTPPLHNCGGACVDWQTDEAHCGGCDRPCAPGQECRAAACTCVPACTGRECGPDGCGGSCGTCPAGRTCGADGRCTCVPACTGRECGPDGCGGSCGTCGAGFTCSAAGTCSCAGTVCGTTACCSVGQTCISGLCCDTATWRASFPFTFLKGLAVDSDGTLFVTGKQGTALPVSDGDQVITIALDACGRELRRGTFLPTGAARAVGNAVAVAGPSVYVVGFQAPAVSAGDVGDGFAARLFKASLGLEVSVPLYGSPHNDEVGDIAVAADGNLWAVGAGDTTSAPPSPVHFAWVIKGNPLTGEACGWDPFAPTGDTYDAAWGVAAPPGAGRIYLAGGHDNLGFLTSYASSECSVTAPCGCAPSGRTVTFSPAGMTTTEGRAVVAIGSAFHVVGWSADAAGDYAGFVARVVADRVTPAPVAWNPTPRMDAFLGAATDPRATALFAVGLADWDGSGTSAAADGVVARYDPTSLALSWTVYPAGAGACWDAAVDAADGVIVVCVSPFASSVLRCLPTGTCP